MAKGESIMLWHQLSSPIHEERCRKRGHRLAAFANVLHDLAVRDYSSRLFGHWSHDVFIIGTASSYEASFDLPEYKLVTLENVRGQIFAVSFAEAGAATFGWHRENDRDVFDGCLRECRANEVVPIVDEVIQKSLPPVECVVSSGRSLNRNRALAQPVAQADTDQAAVLGH